MPNILSAIRLNSAGLADSETAEEAEIYIGILKGLFKQSETAPAATETASREPKSNTDYTCGRKKSIPAVGTLVKTVYGTGIMDGYDSFTGWAAIKLIGGKLALIAPEDLEIIEDGRKI